ncbi:unnamed protein product [Phytomonas sp. Hart1]|nr:unnamed protein product [Phytomonas sp. Hart1]|eukprot:CCW70733.1 unnamed protein product [Phytomonas sp. isolate Hart1]
MASTLKVTLCQMASSANKQACIDKAVSLVKSAAARGSRLVVLPECFNSPYSCKRFEEFSEALSPGHPTFDALSAITRDCRVWLVAGSIPERKEGKVYNSSMVFGPDGTLRGVHRKVHLFKIHTEQLCVDESEVLSAGGTAEAITMEDVNLKIGVAICFDMRFPQLAHRLASQGTSIIVCPAAFNMVTGPLHWELTARARAMDNQQFVMMCSQARDEAADYVAYGHSLIADPLGRVVGQLDEKEGALDVDLDLGLIDDARARIPILKGIRHDLYSLQWGL